MECVEHWTVHSILASINMDRVMFGAIGMELLDKTLDLLRDGDWHSVDEVIEKLSVPEEKVKAILRFLADHYFIIFNQRKRMIKITSLGLEFLRLPI